MSGGIVGVIVSAPVFLLGVILHELAHAWAAYRLGDDTAKRAGRITLDPLAHLDPLGTIRFIVSSFAGFGFGWAKPVPVNPYNFRNVKRDQLLVSLAGPSANLLQAAAWALLLRLAIGFPGLVPGEWLGSLVDFFLLGVIINVALLLFNLIPIPPLDGSRVIPWLFRLRDPLLMDRLAPIGFFALIIFIQTPLFGAIFGPLHRAIVGLLLRGA